MLEVLQATSIAINGVVLLILVFKYMQDIRHQRLSIENLTLAIEKNRREVDELRARGAAQCPFGKPA